MQFTRRRSATHSKQSSANDHDCWMGSDTMGWVFFCFWNQSRVDSHKQSTTMDTILVFTTMTWKDRSKNWVTQQEGKAIRRWRQRSRPEGKAEGFSSETHCEKDLSINSASLILTIHSSSWKMPSLLERLFSSTPRMCRPRALKESKP